MTQIYRFISHADQWNLEVFAHHQSTHFKFFLLKIDQFYDIFNDWLKIFVLFFCDKEEIHDFFLHLSEKCWNFFPWTTASFHNIFTWWILQYFPKVDWRILRYFTVTNQWILRCFFHDRLSKFIIFTWQRSTNSIIFSTIDWQISCYFSATDLHILQFFLRNFMFFSCNRLTIITIFSLHPNEKSFKVFQRLFGEFNDFFLLTDS